MTDLDRPHAAPSETPDPGGARGSERRQDGLAVGILAACAIGLAVPVLFTSEPLYMDHPVHVAEIHELARSTSGWSEIAYCGISLDTLHSPLWYGILARWVQWTGSHEPLYSLIVLASLLAPALALYRLARRHLAPLVAGALSFLFLVHASHVTGSGSALGGMWTFALAEAFAILALDQLMLDGGRWRRVKLAIAVALVGLTHSFAVLALAVFCALHAVRTIVRARERALRFLLVDAAAVALGAAISAVYWGTVMLAQHGFAAWPSATTLAQMAKIVFLGRDPLGAPPGLRVWLMSAARLPELIVAILALLSIPQGLAPGPCRKLVAYGLGSSVILTVYLGLVATGALPGVYGALTWRLVEFVRVGLAVAAIATLVRVTEHLRVRRGWSLAEPRPAVVAACVLAVLLATAFFAQPLRIGAPWGERAAREMEEVRELWAKLRRLAPQGRVYVQDTFFTPPLERELVTSHVLALTAYETGVTPLGAFYGAVPLRTLWTKSESGALFRERPGDASDIERIERHLRRTRSSLIVVADPALSALLAASDSFSVLDRAGRFTIFSLARPQTDRIEASSGTVRPIELAPGRIRFELELDSAPAPVRIEVLEAFHSFWSLTAAPGWSLSPTADGFMLIEGDASGPTEILLEYRAPALPKVVSLCGCLALLAWIVVRRRVVRESHALSARS